jgi:hypothetical protein
VVDALFEQLDLDGEMDDKVEQSVERQVGDNDKGVALALDDGTQAQVHSSS